MLMVFINAHKSLFLKKWLVFKRLQKYKNG